MQVSRNQIQELKAQIKGSGQQVQSDSELGKQVQELKAKMIGLETELTVAKQQAFNASKSGFNSKINSTMCSAQHPFKQKTQHPYQRDVQCSICGKGNLLHQPFFFRCDQNCNEDLCAFCYYLELSD